MAKNFAQRASGVDAAATADAVAEILTRLRLPLPEAGEYFQGSEGFLLFSSAHGTVIRIMQKDWNFTGYHPLVIQPLGLFDAVNAVVGVYPGLHSVTDRRLPSMMKEWVARTGFHARDLWYGRADQLGCMPVPLPFRSRGLPRLMPLIADTGTIRAVRKNPAAMRAVLAALGIRKDPQHAFYGPLRRSLKAAWPRGASAPDSAKVAAFWRRCEEFTQEGKLVAGWKEIPESEDWRVRDLIKAFRAYDRRLAAASPGAAP